MKPHSFTFIKQFHRNPPGPNIFTRAAHVQRAYDHYRLDVAAKKYPSLRHKIFHTAPMTPYVLRPNDFPYNVEPDVEHKVLWLNPTLFIPYTFDPSEPLIEQILESEFQNRPFVFFRNTKEVSSVFDMIHYQVFTPRTT